jgi:hypothetical protein
VHERHRDATALLEAAVACPEGETFTLREHRYLRIAYNRTVRERELGAVGLRIRRLDDPGVLVNQLFRPMYRRSSTATRLRTGRDIHHHPQHVERPRLDLIDAATRIRVAGIEIGAVERRLARQSAVGAGELHDLEIPQLANPLLEPKGLTSFPSVRALRLRWFPLSVVARNLMTSCWWPDIGDRHRPDPALQACYLALSRLC